MATWRDGAAYAPTERPDGFATPKAEPLPSAAPYRAETPGPGAPPRAFDSPPSAPLKEVAAPERPARDPREAFTIASSLLTAEPAAKKRDPREPIVVAGSTTTSDQPPPPTGEPLPDIPPPAGLPAPAGQYPTPQGLPAQHPPPGQPGQWPQSSQPGRTGQWMRTGPVVPQQGQLPGQPRPLTDAEKSVRQLIFLASGVSTLGLLLPGTAPFILLVGGILAMRAKGLAYKLGRAGAGVGTALIVLQFLTGSLGQEAWFPAFCSLAAAVGYGIAGARYERDPGR